MNRRDALTGVAVALVTGIAPATAAPPAITPKRAADAIAEGFEVREGYWVAYLEFGPSIDDVMARHTHQKYASEADSPQEALRGVVAQAKAAISGRGKYLYWRVRPTLVAGQDKAYRAYARLLVCDRTDVIDPDDYWLNERPSS